MVLLFGKLERWSQGPAVFCRTILFGAWEPGFEVVSAKPQLRVWNLGTTGLLRWEQN